MFKVEINKTPVFMGKFFSPKDCDVAVAKVLEIEDISRVLFVDTPPTTALAECVCQLRAKAIRVIVRDHHGVPSWHPCSLREEAMCAAAGKVRVMGSDVVISTREEHPACSTLIETGEFDGVNAVIADPDPDGLLGAMKALGITYPKLDKDAAVLDGPRSKQRPDTLSPLAMLLVKGMASLPPYNPKAPEIAEAAKETLFTHFVAATQGSTLAKNWLETKAKIYQAGIRVALELAGKAKEVTPGVRLVDTRGSDRFDLATLSGSLERKGAKVTVIVKDFGPIATEHGCQYSLAVTKEYQREVDLQDFLVLPYESSPKAGVIFDATFLLHASEAVWKEQVFPSLVTWGGLGRTWSSDEE
jgi:hypothetical protein